MYARGRIMGEARDGQTDGRCVKEKATVRTVFKADCASLNDERGRDSRDE